MASNQMKKQEFQWPIENFSECCLKRGEKLLSPIFTAENLGGSAWFLELYLKGYESGPDSYVSCFITRKEDDAGPLAIKCDFEVEVLDKDDWDHFIEFVKGVQKFEKGSSWGLINIMKLDKLVEIGVYHKTLYIVCTLSGSVVENSTYSPISRLSNFQVSKHFFSLDITNLNFTNQQKVFKIPISELSHLEIAIDINNATASEVDVIHELKGDIKRMYTDKIHTDIKLKAGTEVFPAHKSILSTRSPVFRAMFDNDMAESRRGEVDISDLEAKTVGLLLEYIYTGTVNELDCKSAMKLIVAADKYEVLKLKNKCADLLVLMLSDANVCEILVTADMVQHSILKSSAFNHIKMQPRKIFKSEEWKHFVKNNMLLATETATEVAMLLEDLAKEQTGK